MVSDGMSPILSADYCTLRKVSRKTGKRDVETKRHNDNDVSILRQSSLTLAAGASSHDEPGVTAAPRRKSWLSGVLPGKKKRSSFEIGGRCDRSEPQSPLLAANRLERYASALTLLDVKMERQRLRTQQPASPTADVITPPQDFRDETKTGADDEAVIILEPPVMFQQHEAPPMLRSASLGQQRAERPKTDLFWAVDPGSWAKRQPSGGGASGVPADVDATFRKELERLKSHSLLLRFPADGAARVHYRSSKSVVVASSINQYRIRAEETVEEHYQSELYDAVSETESDDDDEDQVNDAVKDGDQTTPVANRRQRSPGSSQRRSSASGARLSSSSGISSQATTASSTASEADADSGIDGVSPRLSAAAFGETTLSPSQSILFIDSVSARNSVVNVQEEEEEEEEEARDDSTHDAEDATSGIVEASADEGITDPRASVIIAEGDPRRDRAHRVALELLHTERTYVDVLHLLDQVFQFRIDQENRVHNMFAQELIPQMFSNIKSLFKLHHDYFLPRLEERMREWDDQEQHERRIGDIMTSFAPFLKMYAEYVRNFDHATNLISTMMLKAPRFAAIIDEIQQLPQSGHLSLQHHMLTPIQRVPRYEMLLRDYLRRLPEDSADRAETEKALHLVSTAAKHANEAMKKIDQFKQLLEIQESLGGAVDLVSPTRELVKEGKIVKISARSGDHQERYLFLFTDLLLLCSPRLISNRVIGVGSGLPPYRVRARFNVAQVEVLEGDNLETANTFYLREGAKTVELYTGTQEEKEAWIDALFAAMTELTRRKSSLRISPVHQQQQIQQQLSRSPSSELAAATEAGSLGKTAPTFVKMDTVSRCYQCQGQFSVMKRKHHCYSCGKVICNRCSSHKMQLPYDGAKALRVCDSCHISLTASSRRESNQDSPSSSPELVSPPPSLRSGLLEVDVETPSVLSGYLSLKTRGKTWQRRWFALRSDFVLYSYRSHQAESRAMTATPVPGFVVSLLSGSSSLLADGASPSHQPNSGKSNVTGTPESGMISERDRSFKMAHVHKSYQFQAASRQEAEKWVHFLQMAARADLPSPT